MTKFILTVLGKDKPGIISKIANVVSSTSGNIEDVQASILSGYFTIVLYFSYDNLDQSEIHDLKNEIELLLKANLSDLDCKIFIDYLPDSKIDDENNVIEEVCTISISAKDRPGLLAYFAKFCSKKDISITSLRTVKYGDTFFIFAGIDSDLEQEDIDLFLLESKELGMHIKINLNKA